MAAQGRALGGGATRALIVLFMRIPSQLPRFPGKEVFLVAVGKQEGVVYRCFEDTIVREAHIQVPTPRYSDREGFFATRSGGRTYRSGSVYESKGGIATRDFIRTLLTELEVITQGRDIAHIYVFAPAFARRWVLAAIPSPVRSRTRVIVSGIYYRKHPFDLLAVLANAVNIPQPFSIEEREKILDMEERLI